MKKIFFLLFVSVSVWVSAQKTTEVYNQLWEQVYMDELSLLPKSALKKVNKIHQKAKKDKNEEQKIKCLIYQSKFALTLEEDTQVEIIQDFKAAIKNTQNNTSKAILNNMLAKMYWDYYQQNRWKIHRRTKTNNNIGDDFRTWDLDRLSREIRSHFQQSLKDAVILKKTSVDAYKELIETSTEVESVSLYEFLALNAISYYKDSRSSLTKPKEAFVIDDEKYLTEIETLVLESPDSTSHQFLTLQGYQDLLQFHKEKKNTQSYFKTLFIAIDYVLDQGSFENKKELKRSFLESLSQQYVLSEKTTLLYFEMAKTHFDLKNYHRSLTLCNQIITAFSDVAISGEAQRLKKEIEKQKLDVQLEKYVPILKKSKALITYRNVQKSSFSIIKINNVAFTTLQKFKHNEKAQKKKFLEGLSKIKKWTVNLKDVKDFKEHTTEIVLPELANGKYLLLGETGQEVFAYTDFQVTNLTLLRKPQGVFQVLNRDRGSVIQHTKVHLKKEKKYRRDTKLDKKFTTNQNGEFVYKSKRYYYGVNATVTTEKDTAVFYQVNVDAENYPKKDEIDEEITIRPFLFTDRSIYRPGQTVYFKAILIKKQGEITVPFTDEYVELLIEDVNGDEVKEFNLKLNDYGTVSGEFKIPENGLTGEYTFEFDESDSHESKFYDDADFEFDDYREYTISVEEYKRPKFETSFNPVKGIYKINDTVNVTGKATALAGSNITDAKVSYRVVRKARYPRWCWWIPMPSNSQEIAHGETTTLADGTYTIPFKAVPDETIAAKNQPVFYYTVYADVTDVNGETRSAETEVKVGYHALNLSITTARKIDIRSKDQEIHLSTENLNGEFIPAQGVLKIYKLIAPETPQTKRPWKKPDFPIIADAEYQKWFPNQSFEDVSNPKKWKKGALVYQTKFDTATEKMVLLNNFKKWEIGNYQIIAQAQDVFGKEVKDEVLVSFIDKKAKKVADNSLFQIFLDENSYSPKDEVVLSVGSASTDMTVFVEVEKENKIVATYALHLNNEIKQLKVPVTEKDKEGFFIHWYWINQNSFRTGETYVPVLRKSTNLNIETLTFRDVLEPGAKEKWSFKITGPDNEKVTSEVLASMYDTSLDQFKPHNWNFNPINHNKYRTGYRTSATSSFKTESFHVFANSNRYYRLSKVLASPKFNWFGFSFSNNRWVQRNYIREISYVVSSHKKVKDESIVKGMVKLTILDAEDNEMIPGANVLSQKRKDDRTVSDFDGIAKLKAKKGDVLEISFIGYETHFIKIEKNFNHYIVRLSPDSSALDEVVVVGYGTQKKKSVTGSVTRGYASALSGRVAGVSITNASGNPGASANIRIRGVSSISGKNPLYVIDGVPYVATSNNTPLELINPNDLESVEVLKDAAATAIYGSRGANGVVLISTKSGAKKLEKSLSQIKARSNFNETAFFFPQLRTNEKGEISFEFTMPEDLTRWKLQLLAHDKQLNSAIKTLTAVTQKQLMVIPNTPRFLREGDQITLSTKIANLTDEVLQGKVRLELTDAVTGKNIDALLQNFKGNQDFSVTAKGNSSVAWTLQIPEDISAVQYKIVAATNDFSDGEQNVLPVLSNRMLVTETLPLWVNGGQTKTFILDGLKNNESETLKHHQLSLEITSNPAWYAVQALPYLMEYPYECAEQTFARYYANQLASHIVNSNPKIKEVFEQWSNSDALVSNLEKNPELKSIIIQETPWLRDAQSETEQKKRMALLFNLSKMEQNLESAVNKLDKMQMSNGGFPWFKGSRYANRYITQHVVQGYHHLKQLGVSISGKKMEKMMAKAQQFLDRELVEDYEKLLERAQTIKDNAKTKKEGIRLSQQYLARKHLYGFQLQYLYVLSFNLDRSLDGKVKEAVAYYNNQAKGVWKGESLYNKGLLALIHHRNHQNELTKSIVASLKENSILSEEMGRYWKENTSGWSWYQDPIVTQSLLIEAFSEIEENDLFVDELKQWLLKNKQVQQWKTTKATSEAVYALLLQGSDWLSINESVEVAIGGKPIPASKLEQVQVEAGTGYYKTQWKASEVIPELATVTLTKKDKGVAWGALYWQYFEDLDNIKQAETPLSLKKEVFVKKNTDAGPTLVALDKETSLKVGDLLTVRIELTTDRNVEFIHMKDMRAAGLEPVDVISKYKWQDGLGYYQSTKDTATHFFFDKIRKGVYVFEYDVRVSHKGLFSNGITNIESMYAPEFSSHSKGIKIEVE